MSSQEKKPEEYTFEADPAVFEINLGFSKRWNNSLPGYHYYLINGADRIVALEPERLKRGWKRAKKCGQGNVSPTWPVSPPWIVLVIDDAGYTRWQRHREAVAEAERQSGIKGEQSAHGAAVIPGVHGERVHGQLSVT